MQMLFEGKPRKTRQRIDLFLVCRMSKMRTIPLALRKSKESPKNLTMIWSVFLTMMSRSYYQAGVAQLDRASVF